MEQSSIIQPYNKSLDGLRGIAILLVIFFHNYSFIQSSTFGWLGVDLFFVLSGYLITNILINTVGRPGYLKNFYMRRVLRIFPLYYLFLLLMLVIFPALGLFKNQLAYPVEHQAWLWTYLQNLLYAIYPASETHLVGHLWSLAVEEQFYFIWPFIVLWVKKPKPLLFVMLGILAIIISARILFFLAHAADFNYTMLYTFTRFDGLCIGSMIALLHKMNFRFLSNYMAVITLSLAGFNFLFYFLTINNREAYPYYFFIGYTTFTAIFGMLVHEIVANKGSLLNRFLSFFPLRYLGRISYGLYIFHWPIYLLLSPVVYLFLSDRLPSLPQNILQIICATASALAALIVSSISYYTFEIRFLKLKEKFRYFKK